ncbi:kinase-like domain-containing protein [Blastocladiella britannica]|nr:kinase-like domain-containing protein [Blastocladiella britannica]
MATAPTEFPALNFRDLEIKSELGRGQFGTVYLADYVGTLVAAKEVAHIPGMDFAKYFAREVNALADARHPNCIQLMGLAHDPSQEKLYIVTEYVPNGNVSEHWIHNREVDLPWRLRVSFAVDTARALAYLHSKNLIHRDLKGQNLLVTENRRVKVCDFGLARLRAQNDEERKRLSFCGTDAYMAPEIMLCSDFDALVDTFSYGVFLLELWTRVRPESFQRSPMLGMSVDMDTLTCPDDCPVPLWDLTQQCLEADPKARPGWRDILGVLAACEQLLVDREAAAMLAQANTAAGTGTEPKSTLAAGGGLHVGAEIGVVVGLPAGTGSTLGSAAALAQWQSAGDVSETSPSHDSITVLPIDTAAPPLAVDGSRIVDSHTTPLTVSADDNTRVHPHATATTEMLSLPHRFSLLPPPSMTPCRLCHKRIGLHRRLVCDDCGYTCHRRCAALAPASCASVTVSHKPGGGNVGSNDVGPLKPHQEKYLADLQRRTTENSGGAASSTHHPAV